MVAGGELPDREKKQGGLADDDGGGDPFGGLADGESAPEGECGHERRDAIGLGRGRVRGDEGERRTERGKRGAEMQGGDGHTAGIEEEHKVREKSGADESGGDAASAPEEPAGQEAADGKEQTGPHAVQQDHAGRSGASAEEIIL